MLERLQSLRDEERTQLGKIEDLRFRYAIGEDVSEEEGECLLKVAGIRSRIADTMRSLDSEESISVQYELMRRYAQKHRTDPDVAGHFWQKEYSERFRKLWDEKRRTVPEYENLLYRNGGH